MQTIKRNKQNEMLLVFIRFIKIKDPNSLCMKFIFLFAVIELVCIAYSILFVSFIFFGRSCAFFLVHILYQNLSGISLLEII